MQCSNSSRLQQTQLNGKKSNSKQWGDNTSSRYRSRNGSTSQWAPDVNILLGTAQWLKLHGLKKNKLELKKILSSIGFKHSEEYVKALQKPVKASYSKGLFPQYAYADGTIYNLLATSEKLRRIESQLTQVIQLYQERLEWLTSASRLVFGVLQEQAISIVLDMQCSSTAELTLIKNALISLVKEQLLFISRFNVIRCAPEVDRWQEKSVNVTTDSIEGVIKWIQNLQVRPQHDISCTVEGLLQASKDGQVDCIYLCTDGSCSIGTREILKRKLQDILVPVHIVALNSVSPSSLTFLQDLTEMTKGRFHKFRLSKNTADDLALSTLNGVSEKSTDYCKPKMEVGVRQDVIELWEELDTARNTLAEVQAIQLHISQKETTLSRGDANPPHVEEPRKESAKNELYMSSKEWLKKHSLSAMKLGFYDLLSNIAFRHCDGVVEVPNPRNESNLATVKSKLVNARYCDKFAHVRWKDGQIFHVHVSGDVHRNYERRITAVLDSYKQRMQWLQKGSRELFGTIIEDQVTILIDTSASMNSRLFLVKDKLYQLLQEQIKHKQKFNLIKFDSRVQAWRSRLVDCNDRNIDDAWQWIKGLVVGGSTNTLGALKLALSDTLCSAVYMLTDGRPDQPPLSILSQIHLQDPVPIHTISFNCSDESANEFLYKLSANTNGRFHYFSENETDKPVPRTFESEDLRLIREEIEKGVHDVQRLTRLRNWCAQLDWYGSRKEEKTETARLNVFLCIWSILRRNAIYLLRTELRPSSAPLIRRPKQAPNTTFSRSRTVKKKRVKKPKAKPENKQIPDEIVVDKEIEKKSSSSSESSSEDEETSVKSESEKSLEVAQSDDLSEEGKKPVVESSDSSKDIKKEIEQVKKKKKKKKKVTESASPAAVEEKRPSSKLPSYSKPRKNSRQTSSDPAKGVYTESNKRNSAPQPQKAATKGPWLRNHKVLARNDVDGFYYPGVLRTNINSRYADVAFCDFESQIVSLRYIIPNEGARPCPILKVGDFVLVKTPRETGLSCYVPGVVYVMPLRQSKASKCYTIIRYNGKKATSLRKDLIKISQSRYAFACRYIKDCEITANKSPTVSVFSSQKKKKDQSEDKDKSNSSSSNENSDSDVEKSKRNTSNRKANNDDDSDKHSSSDDNQHSQGNKKDVSINDELEQIKRALLETKESQLKSFEEQQERFDTLRQQLHDAMEDQAKRQEDLKKHYDGLVGGKDVVDGASEAGQDEKLEEAKRLLQEQQENMINDFKKQQELLDQLLQQKNTGREQNGKENPKKTKKKKKGKTKSSNESSSSSDSGDSSDSSQGNTSKSPEQSKNEPVVEGTEVPSKIEFHVTSPGKEACLWTKGSHGLLISRVPLEEDSAVENRPVPTRLQCGEEVLARWPDDGWYYRGTIQEPAGDSYFVEDSVGNMEEIARHNIISDEDDAPHEIQVNDSVVALHPNFSFSYAPGVVVDIEDNMLYRVRFYDGQQDVIPREEIYFLTQEKFSDAVSFIVRCEESLLGQAVVARNDFDGLFYLGNIRERVGNGRQYVVQWPEGGVQVQSSAFIFGAHTKRHQLAIGDKVLALSNNARALYEPGWITGIDGKKLSVKFSTGKRSSQVDPMQCFWLSSDYYDRIVDYISKNNRT